MCQTPNLHFFLQSSGYYDASNQFANTSLASSVGSGSNNVTSNSNQRSDVLGSNPAISSSSNAVGSSSLTGGSAFDKSVANNSSLSTALNTDTTSSPVPSAGSLQQQQQQQQQQQTFNLNAFAAQGQAAAAATLPPGYAYFYSKMPGLAGYGAAPPGAYPAMAAVPTAAGGTATTQFQQKNYQSK